MATSNSTLEIKIKTTGASKARKGISGIGSSADKARKQIGLLKGILIGSAGLFAVKALRDSIRYTSSIEDLRIQLKFLTGTTKNASMAFKEMTKFASETPFALKEIQNASASLLVAVGNDVSKLGGMLQITGEIAAQFGLSFQQTAEQLQRAMSAGVASADIFREKGVSAMMGFRAGVKYSTEQTRSMITQWSKDNKGAIDELKDTFTGRVSMMGDAWDKLLLTFGEAGALDTTKDIVKAITDMLKDPEVIKGAKSIGQGIKDWVNDLGGAEKALEEIWGWTKIIGTTILGFWGIGKVAKYGKIAIETFKGIEKSAGSAGKKVAEIFKGRPQPLEIDSKLLPDFAKGVKVLKHRTADELKSIRLEGIKEGEAFVKGVGLGAASLAVIELAPEIKIDESKNFLGRYAQYLAQQKVPFADLFAPFVEEINSGAVKEGINTLSASMDREAEIYRATSKKLAREVEILDATFTESNLFNRSKDNAVNIPELQAPITPTEELKLEARQWAGIAKITGSVFKITEKLTKKRTELEKITEAQANAEKLLNTQLREGKITLEQFSEGMNMMVVEIQNYNDIIEQIAFDKKMEKIANRMEDSITDGIMNIKGELSSLKEFAGNIFRSIAAEMVRAKISKPIASFVSSFLGDALGSMFGAPSGSAMLSSSGYSGGPLQARAKGGPVSAGSTYLVGEEGVELFVPNMGGNIISHGDMDKELKKFTLGDELTLLEDVQSMNPLGSPWFDAMTAILGKGTINGKVVRGIMGWDPSYIEGDVKIGDIVHKKAPPFSAEEEEEMDKIRSNIRNNLSAEDGLHKLLSYFRTREMIVGNIDNITQKIRDLVARGHEFYEILATNFFGRGNAAFTDFVLPPESEPKSPAKSLTGFLGAGFLAAVVSQMYKSLKSPLIPPMISGGGFGNAPSSITPGGFTMIPGRANGGTVSGNSPYIVGENGAELFIPNRTGSIVPNGTNIGGDTIVNVSYSPQVNALDPRTAATVIAQNASTIVGVVRQAFNRSGQSVVI